MRTAFAVSVAALTLTGCIGRIGLDPVGEAASAEGNWTISGAVPSAASCGEVAFVRARFFEDDGHRDHAGLVFECAAGRFDTRPERIVAEGSWTVALVAIRADGSVVREGARQEVDANTGHIVFEPLDVDGVE